MTWANLLSGLIGGLVGGLCSVAASWILIKNERSRTREDADRAASNAITENIITISNALHDIKWAMDPQRKTPDSTIDLLLDKVHAAAQNILYKYSAVLTDEELRSQISKLINMINEWYNSARESSRVVNQQHIESIESYIGHVNQSIQNHLGEQAGAINS